MNLIGKISGNPRLDPKSMIEPDLDTEEFKQMWFDALENDPDYAKDVEEEFFKGIAKINKTFDAKKLHFYITGKSHLDMAYKWRFEQTIPKGYMTLAKAIFHYERFPGNFQFCFSTPQVFFWVKENYPAFYPKLKEYITSKKIELLGGLWVECDGMMPSGEAVIRQRLYGMKFYQDEFGFVPTVESLPDSFGFNVGLPQLLKKSGAECFYTHKMTWNQTNMFPFTHFRWESPDGSQILVASIPDEKGAVHGWDRFAPYRFLLKPSINKRWNYESNFNAFEENLDLTRPLTEVLILEGRGDGGHGPTHQQVAELICILNASKKHGLTAEWGTVRRFFNDLMRKNDQYTVWADELFLEDHQGTFSVHPEVKRNNRHLETLIPAIERLATIVSLFNPSYQYPFPIFAHMWKKLSLLQFHDVLPSSCVPEVLDDAVDYWEDMYKTLDRVFHEIIEFICPPTRAPLVIFNPLPWARTCQVFIPYEQVQSPPPLSADGKPLAGILFYQEDGKEISQYCQPVAAEPEDLLYNRPAGWWTMLTMPPYGIALGRLEFKADEVARLQNTLKEPFQVDINDTIRISNSLSAVTFAKSTGALISFTNTDTNQGHNIVQGDKNNLAVGYEDDNPRYMAWNLKLEYWKYPLNFAQDQNCAVVLEDQGPVFATIKITKTMKSSEVVQRVRLFKDDPIVYCLWSSDWKEKNVTLKLGLNTLTNAVYSTSDQMYCALRRSTTPTSKMDVERYEKVMHDYADLSTPANEWGIAVLNEGKYAFDTNQSELRITLHRTPEYPPPAAEAWIKDERLKRLEKDGTQPPTHIGIGPISCRYAYYPHRNGTLTTVDGQAHNAIKRKAEEFNNPCIVGSINPTNVSHPDQKVKWESLNLSISKPINVELVALKRSEWQDSQQIILRFHEICGISSDHVNIILPASIGKKLSQIHEVDLIERPISDQFEWDSNSLTIRCSFHPFELKTFKIQLKN